MARTREEALCSACEGEGFIYTGVVAPSGESEYWDCNVCCGTTLDSVPLTELLW